MAGDIEKVGFIFECGRDGPDYKVCHHFLGRLNPAIQMVPRFLDRKERLVAECGDVAAGLLQIDNCSRVVVTWDLEPAWGGKACRRKDKTNAIASLRSAKVPLDRVLLLCVEKELECWLMADHRAVATVIGELKHPRQAGNVPEFKKPDRDIKRPKTVLVTLFEQELGRGRKYVDRDHALRIAKAVPDWRRIRRSDSFARFAAKAARSPLD